MTAKPAKQKVRCNQWKKCKVLCGGKKLHTKQFLCDSPCLLCGGNRKGICTPVKHKLSPAKKPEKILAIQDKDRQKMLNELAIDVNMAMATTDNFGVIHPVPGLVDCIRNWKPRGE